MKIVYFMLHQIFTFWVIVFNGISSSFTSPEGKEHIIDRNPTNTCGYNEALNFWEMNHFSEKKKKAFHIFLTGQLFCNHDLNILICSNLTKCIGLKLSG